MPISNPKILLSLPNNLKNTHFYYICILYLPVSPGSFQFYHLKNLRLSFQANVVMFSDK